LHVTHQMSQYKIFLLMGGGGLKLKDKTLKFYIIISLKGLGNSKKILDCINTSVERFQKTKKILC